jgi:hypothetical protein
MHNLMMDADAMYPEGFHPVKWSYKRDYSGWNTHIPRSVAGVKYYFLDFGISVHIPEGEPQRATGTQGRDQDPPEFRGEGPDKDTPKLYNPFKLDIFIIGNMLKNEFSNVTIPPSLITKKTHYLAEIHQCRIPSTTHR